MWLLAPITSQRTLDALAAFGAEGEDVENDLEDELEVPLGPTGFYYAGMMSQDEDMEEDDPQGSFGEK